MTPSSTSIFPKQLLFLMTCECLFQMTCVDLNLSNTDINNVQKNVNNKNRVQKIYECKEQTYNYVIYLI